jgi:hypothetical protein
VLCINDDLEGTSWILKDWESAQDKGLFLSQRRSVQHSAI